MTAAIFLAAAIAVRNPFWPIGYEGKMEVISAEPVVAVATAAPVEDETATAAMLARSSNAVLPRHWIAAKKSLRMGGTASVIDINAGTKRHCVMINGLAYGNGDLVSVNHDGRRFTWQVQGLTEGETVKLKRIRAKLLDKEENLKEMTK